jgi:phosphatidylserine/phosphatidylglycerophosphate/cardiolipin synthase-like enzyme
LLETKAKTLPVELIIPDMKSMPSNQSAADQLKADGISVHTISHPYMHAKMMLVDDQRAYVGSINDTTASIEQNRELGIIVSQPDIIGQINQTFESDWSNSQEL